MPRAKAQIIIDERVETGQEKEKRQQEENEDKKTQETIRKKTGVFSGTSHTTDDDDHTHEPYSNFQRRRSAKAPAEDEKWNLCL